MNRTQELIDQAKADGVTVVLAEGLKLKAVGPETAVAKWRPRLAEQRSWIIAALQPEDPTPEHRCHVCSRPARFGFGVFAQREQEGRWACLEHREESATPAPRTNPDDSPRNDGKTVPVDGARQSQATDITAK